MVEVEMQKQFMGNMKLKELKESLDRMHGEDKWTLKIINNVKVDYSKHWKKQGEAR